MNKFKPINLALFVAGVTFLVIALLPGVNAQAPVVHTIEEIEIQGSPRSPLDDQRVLVIGDSQVRGQPGITLGHHVTAAGVTYYARAGQTGWGIKNWYNQRRSMDHLVARHNPTLVILILGGNDWYRARKDSFPLLVSQFWDSLQESVNAHTPEGKTSSICWIEPPRVVGPREGELQPLREKVSQVIRTTIGFDHFVRSQDITGTFGRHSDGVHFTREGANTWMRRSIPRLERCVENQL